MFGFFKKISKPKDIEEVTPEDVKIEPEEIKIDLSEVEVGIESFDDLHNSKTRTRISNEVERFIQGVLINGPRYYQTKSLMESDEVTMYNVGDRTYEEMLKKFPGAAVKVVPTKPGCNKLVTNIDDPDYLLEIFARKQVEEFYSDK